MDTNINDFCKEKACIYKGERYSVRDNGAILRYPQSGKRPRPNDSKWTFGKPNNKHGYLEIGSARVHIIVATAFYGARSSKIYVVDHIDTNRRNNRIENLRWLTRLENVLSNPITRKKIEFICGCRAEEFLSNPENFRNKFIQDYNFGWMRTVSKEESMECLKHGLAWAANDKLPSGGTIGEWIFNSDNIQRNIDDEFIVEEQNNHLKSNKIVEKVFQKVEEETGLSKDELSSKTKKKKYLNARVYAAKLLNSEINLCLSKEEIGKLIGVSKGMVNQYINNPESYLKNCDYFKVNSSNQTSNVDSQILFNEIEIEEKITDSLTPNAIQRNWCTPSEFPFTPQIIGNNPLISYANNLIKGKVFSHNKYGSSLVVDSGFSENYKSLFVMTEAHNDNVNIKKYALTKVTYENGLFVHSGHTFFSKEGAEKEFTIAQGLKWLGGDSIDDYC